jgi:hypothetical protein
MELILMIIEGFVILLDLLVGGADVYAWFKGAENRRERRAARAAGNAVPPKDKWNRRVLILSAFVVALTAGLILWWWVK